ncbi:hypothetical protein WAK64_14790 [Bacillus spongiae]|uniref:Uncharacterized protein n=1 Tax=Bacillus spongiae TaxID=2683610 RepID=A0ABU8HGM8_9BACI
MKRITAFLMLAVFAAIAACSVEAKTKNNDSTIKETTKEMVSKHPLFSKTIKMGDIDVLHQPTTSGKEYRKV